MKDQHEKIKGYRDLNQKEINMINRVKELAEQCGDIIAEIEAYSDADQRKDLALGKTNLQTGFMWVIRSIAKPNTFG